MVRRLSIVVIALLMGQSATVSAEVLPGVMDASTIKIQDAKGKQQWQDAKKMVRSRATTLGYSKSQIEQALKPSMVRKGEFTHRLKDGTEISFPWYRVGYAENRLANHKVDKRTHRRNETNKGGLRMHYGVNQWEVHALALKMDTKLAITGDAIGGQAIRGAKGGIGLGRVTKVGSQYKAKVGDYVDPAQMDRNALMVKFGKSYRKNGGDVGPGLDIQAGDVNTKAPQMKVLAETYGTKRIPSSGVSGKAVVYHKDGSINPRGGIEYRATSTGDGVWMAARLAARKEGVKLRGATVACQGWGEVGRAFAMSALKDGARPIAIQRRWNVGGKKVVGTMLHPLGKNAKPKQIKNWINDLEEMHRSGEDVRTYKNGKFSKYFKAGLDVSDIKADIVGHNAMGNVLNKDTVPASVRAGTHQGKRRILAEGANLAQTTQGAKLIDKYRTKLIGLSGDFANFGGVDVSNYEAVQNHFSEAVTSKKAKQALQGRMRAGWNKIQKIVKTRGVTERKAIELLAVDGMMKRSLHLKGAPISNLERRVISRAKRKSFGNPFGAKRTR